MSVVATLAAVNDAGVALQLVAVAVAGAGFEQAT